MAEFTAQTLEDILLMMDPIDFAGNSSFAQGKKTSGDNVVRAMLNILYNAGGAGAMSIETMVQKINEVLGKAEPEALASYKKCVHIFNSLDKKVDEENAAASMAMSKDNTKSEETKFEEIIGDKLTGGKQMMIITVNTPYLSPAVRNAERCEIFLNSIPSIHASRMVPILEVEFGFNRDTSDDASKQTFGLPRFLLGASEIPKDSATEKLIQARQVTSKDGLIKTTTVGMEMFTSPQTLVPIDVGANRYADILDPMRPVASIENFTVNVTPTVGLYSYKKGTLAIKLHDRSRMSELADLIRPQVFQNARSSPTVWITYGWRYPYEPSESGGAGSRSIADFINNNMLVREAYGIANSQFSFDQVGQAQINLELWTKGVGEMRTVRITDSSKGMSNVMKKITDLAEKITRYANALNFGKADGISKEIRAYTLIESAERGVFPDMSADEIQGAISKLNASILKGSPDSEAAKELAKALGEFYKSSDKKNLDLKNQVKQQAGSVAKARFDETTKGKDPFLFHAEKNTKHKSEAKVPDHPFAEIIDKYNKNASDNKVKEFKKRLVSLGKLFSVFVSQAFEACEAADELQLVFHQFNEGAGLAGGTNIAEFPIDMPVFFDQYREMIEQRGDERMTLEEFLKLIIDAQVLDERALGYGFRQFFEPYDPASPHEPKLKKGEEENYESALSGLGKQHGPFVKPSLEMFIETTYASDGAGNDLLNRFQLQETGNDAAEVAAGHLHRIMRIHIFDRQNNPYKTQSVILKGEGSATYVEVSKDYAKGHTPDSKKNALLQLARGVDVDGNKVLVTTDLADANGTGPYATIKHMISKTMPSIIYGANGTMVTNATLSSKQDALLAASQMQSVASKSGKPSSIGNSNGGGVGGLPLRVIPAQLSVSTMGCPLLNYGQLFFIDFNTGTTVDNIYGITGLTHTIAPGKFTSEVKMTFYDAYGRYEGAPDKLKYIQDALTKAPEKKK